MHKLIQFLFFFFIFISLPFVVVAYDPLTPPNNIYGIGIVNHTDLEDVSNLVNVNGGDWGYVKVVITEDNRNKEIWQKFLDDCRRLHLIPIIRTATSFKDGYWEIPKVENIDSWISFFDSLNWVTENRYIIINNEPNHSKEWGGKLDPPSYAIYLKTFAERLNNASPDYFVLNAGFDQDTPNSTSKMDVLATMDEKRYIDEMIKAVPDVFNYIDGWNSHSYPNPAFSGSKNGTGRRSIRGYEWELSLINKDLPVFITETGWIRHSKNEEIISNNLKYAYEEIWGKDKRVVAVTPFILNYQNDPFYEFSWKNKDGSFFRIYNDIQSLQKLKGEPKQKISGEIVFNFLNPLSFKNSIQTGFALVRNTGQAIWTQSESHVINELENEITVSNTKFESLPPFKTGLVIYTLRMPNEGKTFYTKLGLYVRGERVGDVYNGKIISF